MRHRRYNNEFRHIVSKSAHNTIPHNLTTEAGHRKLVVAFQRYMSPPGPRRRSLVSVSTLHVPERDSSAAIPKVPELHGESLSSPQQSGPVISAPSTDDMVQPPPFGVKMVASQEATEAKPLASPASVTRSDDLAQLREEYERLKSQRQTLLQLQRVEEEQASLRERIVAAERAARVSPLR